MNQGRTSRRLLSIALAVAFVCSMLVPSAYVRAGAGPEAGKLKSMEPPQTAAVTQAQASQANARVSMYFEANRGQSDPRVNFVARGGGYTLFLTPTEAVYVLTEKPQGGATKAGDAEMPWERGHPARNFSPQDAEQPVTKYALRMKLEG